MTNFDQLDIEGGETPMAELPTHMLSQPRPARSPRDEPETEDTHEFVATSVATMNRSVVISADALDLPLRDNSVDCVVTSPPYWGLRQYGDAPGELGNNQSMDDYIGCILIAAREVGRVLKDDGLFWLNLGDTAAGSGGAGGDYNKGGSKSGKVKWKQGDTRISPMQWCSIPHRIVHALQDDGWLLRADICWDKTRVRPEDVRHVRRPLISKEPIFMLAKTRTHRFYEKHMAELGNVWHFPPAKGKNHQAPFPDELPRRCILASTLRGDVVVDPFDGSGTTSRVAVELGRVGIGLDLYAGRTIPDDTA